MEKKIKRIFVLIISLFVFCSNGLFAYEKPVIIDGADLFSDEEEALLQEDMKAANEYGNVMILTNQDEYYGEASDFAERQLKSQFDDNTSLIFLIDMYNRRIEIYSDGDMYKVIGKTWANAITDNVYTYASDKNYFACAQETFKQLTTVLEGGKINAPMKTVSLVLFSIGLAFLLLYLYLNIWRNSVDFGRKTALAVSASEDKENVLLVNKTKTSEKKSVHSSSGSSGGSGGGGSSGGGSSGGGGGHGF